MNKYSLMKPARNAIFTNGRGYDRRVPVQFQECVSQQRTGVAAGSPLNFQFPLITEKDNILAAACAMDGVPVILGVVLTREQTVSVPTVAGGSGDPLIASQYERLAKDVMYLTPGKASNYFQQKRTTDPLPELLNRLRMVAPDTMRAMEMCIPEGTTATPRSRMDDGEGLTGALDHEMSMAYRGQPTLDAPPMRVVYPGATAGPIAEPANGTVVGDIIAYPFTGDGNMQPGADGSGFGCEDSGMLHGDVFDTGNQFILYYTPNNNAELYRQEAGETPTFGTFTIRMYIVWRLAKTDKKIKVGRVFNWNNQCTTWNTGSQFADIPAASIAGAIIHGWFPKVFRPASGVDVKCLADAGPAVDYTPTVSMITPSLSPVGSLYVNQTYMEVGDGQKTEYPLDGANTHKGYEWFQWWNSFATERAREQYLTSRQNCNEVPLYGTADQKAATSTRISAFTLRYGATYAGGAAVASLGSVPTIGGLSSSFARTIGCGGLYVIPTGWCNVWSAGFPGFGTRPLNGTDQRPVRVASKGGWTQPTLPDGNPWPIESVGAGPTYSDIGTPAECCTPCGGGGATQPLPANPASPNAPLGDALAPTSILSPGMQNSLTTG